MKRMASIGILLLGLCAALHAQRVYPVEYESQADVRVFVAEYESEADLKVFKVTYESQAGTNDGRWFFTDYESQADKRIFVVKYKSQADIVIFYVKYESQAGWRTEDKKHFFEGEDGRRPGPKDALRT